MARTKRSAQPKPRPRRRQRRAPAPPRRALARRAPLVGRGGLHPVELAHFNPLRDAPFISNYNERGIPLKLFHRDNLHPGIVTDLQTAGGQAIITVPSFGGDMAYAAVGLASGTIQGDRKNYINHLASGRTKTGDVFDDCSEEIQGTVLKLDYYGPPLSASGRVTVLVSANVSNMYPGSSGTFATVAGLISSNPHSRVYSTSEIMNAGGITIVVPPRWDSAAYGCYDSTVVVPDFDPSFNASSCFAQVLLEDMDTTHGGSWSITMHRQVVFRTEGAGGTSSYMALKREPAVYNTARTHSFNAAMTPSRITAAGFLSEAKSLVEDVDKKIQKVTANHPMLAATAAIGSALTSFAPVSGAASRAAVSALSAAPAVQQALQYV